jgi:hypothetical protein
VHEQDVSATGALRFLQLGDDQLLDFAHGVDVAKLPTITSIASFAEVQINFLASRSSQARSNYRRISESSLPELHCHVVARKIGACGALCADG